MKNQDFEPTVPNGRRPRSRLISIGAICEYDPSYPSSYRPSFNKKLGEAFYVKDLVLRIDARTRIPQFEVNSPFFVVIPD